MHRPVVANIAAIAAAFVVIVAVSALWVVNLRLGPRMDGFTGGAMLVFLPILLVGLMVFWVVIRVLFVRNRTLTALIAFGGGALLAFVVMVINCQESCFLPGNERMVGWFAVIGTGLAALAHHLVLGRFARETVDAEPA